MPLNLSLVVGNTFLRSAKKWSFSSLTGKDHTLIHFSNPYETSDAVSRNPTAKLFLSLYFPPNTVPPSILLYFDSMSSSRWDSPVFDLVQDLEQAWITKPLRYWGRGGTHHSARAQHLQVWMRDHTKLGRCWHSFVLALRTERVIAITLLLHFIWKTNVQNNPCAFLERSKNNQAA